jgi:lipoate synthase
MALGFAHVQASPLTRSSYHAREAADASSGASAPVPVSMSVR